MEERVGECSEGEKLRLDPRSDLELSCLNSTADLCWVSRGRQALQNGEEGGVLRPSAGVWG